MARPGREGREVSWVQRVLILVMAVIVTSLGSAPATRAAPAQKRAPASAEQARKAETELDRRPNVLLYVVCSLRPDGLASYGNFRAKTPNIDALGHDGTLFANTHASSSWTRPSIGSILTGVYPDVHRAEGRDDALAKNLKLLSERFAEQGWATGAVVTTPNVGSFYGFSQGFDDFVELYERRRPGYVSSWEHVARSDQATRRAIEWIDGVSRPFLLMVVTVDPHWPYDPLAEFSRAQGDELRPGEKDGLDSTRDPANRERSRALYQAQVEFNDSSFGRLLEHLRAEKLYDDTIVVFTSDHGEEFGEHGRSLHGENLFEESIRVPLILRYPKTVPAATRIERPVELVDIAPTLLELAGLPGDDSFDGRSLTAQDEPADRSLYATLELDQRDVKSITRYPWKLIRNQRTKQTQLYNLSHDEQELWDLAKKHPRLAGQLDAELSARIEANEKRRAALYSEPPAPAADPDPAKVE